MALNTKSVDQIYAIEPRTLEYIFCKHLFCTIVKLLRSVVTDGEQSANDDENQILQNHCYVHVNHCHYFTTII